MNHNIQQQERIERLDAQVNRLIDAVPSADNNAPGNSDAWKRFAEWAHVVARTYCPKWINGNRCATGEPCGSLNCPLWQWGGSVEWSARVIPGPRPLDANTEIVQPPTEPSLSIGDRVKIYDYPLEKKDFEGLATLVEFRLSSGNGTQDWMVRFDDSDKLYLRSVC